MNPTLTGSARTGRLFYIDNIKGFGMLLVVLGHVMHFYSTREMYSNNLFMGFVALFFMKMFFFFSGFVYRFKDIPLAAFTRRTFVSLIWPCVIIWGGYLVGVSLLQGLSGGSFVPEFFSRDEVLNFYWFCKSLFVCRMALFCFCKLSNRFRSWWSNELLLSLLFVVILYVLSFDLWNIKLMMLFYVAGYAAGKYGILSRFSEKGMALASFAGIVALSVVRYGAAQAMAVKLASMLLPVPILLFVYYSFRRYADREVWLLTEIGRYSLLIYLLHIAFLKVITAALQLCIDISVLYSLWVWIPAFVLLTLLSLWAAKAIYKSAVLSKIILLK